jgi:hypothetical protein
VVRVEFGHDAHIIPDQAVSGIIENPFADHRKSLAWSATTDHMNPAADSRKLPDVISAQLGDGAWDDRAAGKVEVVGACVDRVDLNGRAHVKPRLLKTERHSPCSRE